jgi:hypothetical protein
MMGVGGEGKKRLLTCRLLTSLLTCLLLTSLLPCVEQPSRPFTFSLALNHHLSAYD